MKFPWKASFQCPHCNTPINANVAMELEGSKSYAALVQAVEVNAIRVGQRQSDHTSNRIDTNGHYRTSKGCTDRGQKDNLKRRFVKKGEKACVFLGRHQIGKKDGLDEKKRYTWKEKEKWKMKNDANRGLFFWPDLICFINPTRGESSGSKEVVSLFLGF